MTRIPFYAVKPDLLSVLEQVEHKCRVVYVQAGQHPTRQVQRFNTAAKLPAPGVATQPSSIGSVTYLVLREETSLQLRPIELDAGPTVFAVDQLFNPNSVTLTPGGTWQDRMVITGLVSTVSNDKPAQELMRLFSAPIRKSFSKYGPFYVGTQAMALLEKGIRFGDAEQ